jgi:hypothetical protein
VFEEGASEEEASECLTWAGRGSPLRI